MTTTRSDKKKAQKKGPTGKVTGKAAAADPPSPAALPPAADSASLDETPLTLTAELGRSRMTLDRALQVSDQSLIELDKTVGDPVDIRINGRLYARGEVVTVSENFGVRITEIVDPS